MKITELSKAELLNLIGEYNNYIIDYMDGHGVCQDGCCPVCVGEFYECEFQEGI